MKKEKYKLYRKIYDSFVFNSDDEANEFMKKNPGFGVIGVEQKPYKVFVALNADEGIDLNKTEQTIEVSKHLIELQKIVDELREVPQFSKYVKSKNLGLIDSRLSEIDELLKKGILK